MALASAYVYAFLRQGEFVLLVPGLPHSIDLGRPMPFAGAVAITLLFDAVLGLALYVSTFRPLRRRVGGRQGGRVTRGDGRGDRHHRPAAGNESGCRVVDLPDERLDHRLGAHIVGPDLVRGHGDRADRIDRRRLPVHPLRTAHARGRRNREGRVRLAHLARPHRRDQLGDQRGRRGTRRHPDRTDHAARSLLVHAVHRARARGRDRRRVREPRRRSRCGARHRHAAVGNDVSADAALVAAVVGTRGARSDALDPPRAGRAGEAAPVTRRDRPHRARSRAAAATSLA